MKPFEHINVTTVDEAVTALEYFKGKGVLNAGGTDLLGILKDRILPDYPEALINIKTIAELDYIERTSDGLKLGALAKLSDIARSPLVLDRYGGLAQAAGSVATPEVRNVGTIGGNLCQEVRCWYYRYPHHLGGRIMCCRKGGRTCPALKGDNRYHSIMGGKICFAVCPSDMAVMLTALDAKVRISGPEGERIIPMGVFFNHLGPVLKQNEILTEVRVPKPPDQGRQTFLKYSLRTPIDFALVSVGSQVTTRDGVCTDVKIILGAVAPSPVRATKAEEAVTGKAIDTKSAGEAAEAAVVGSKPLSMNAYKVDIAKALVKRALLPEN